MCTILNAVCSIVKPKDLLGYPLEVFILKNISILLLGTIL